MSDEHRQKLRESQLFEVSQMSDEKFIEPSAGGGALLKHFPGAKGYDLVPQGS